MQTRFDRLTAWITSRPAVFRALPKSARLSLVVGTSVFVLGLCLALFVRRPAPPAPPLAEAPAAAPTTPAAEQQQPEVAEIKPMPQTANVTFNVTPSVPEAWVSWGKKKLGRIIPRTPLVVTRPRDSGPLDVVVRAEGFFPVHTRAHTFSDNKVTVKLTPLDQSSTLLGYRVPLDAGTEGAIDDPDAAIEAPFLTP
ncbi:MAG: hypothetical protein ABW252_15250 [Polyangiales bacterium]